MPGDKREKPLDIVSFHYKNYRDEIAMRTVRPIRLWFGSTAYYPEAQWLLEAFDLDRLATRDFAMSKVKDWHRTHEKS